MNSTDAHNQDVLIWERFTRTLGIQDVDSPNMPALLRKSALTIPPGCAAILVQENLGLCKERPYSTTGIHYVGQVGDIVPRNIAARFMHAALLPRPVDLTTLFRLCHGAQYLIRDGQISMLCPHKGRRLIDPADIPSVNQRPASSIADKPARPMLTKRS